eukprot:scaffold10618_cov55-Attheya_sp.AAC.1
MYTTYKLPPVAPKWPKNKGSLNDIDSTPLVDCFIQQAWDMRYEIVKLKLPSKEDTLTLAPGAAATSTNPPLAENPVIVAIMRVFTSELQSKFGKASDVLQSEGFIGSINICFNSTVFLFNRLTTHMDNCILDVSKHNHCLVYAVVQAKSSTDSHNHGNYKPCEIGYWMPCLSIVSCPPKIISFSHRTLPQQQPIHLGAKWKSLRHGTP